ncbi:hypothetical protein PPYR_08741 [Photinus pyralis]|uniref:L1 transposable element RRM domain-containing protein n=1 Tax=Photinus pyralis TaxID=7054 RepID=A0A5N4AKK2_PHOPY|nr:hypothetical protein PPYR_08741 [Photinus pyralis]
MPTTRSTESGGLGDIDLLAQKVVDKMLNSDLFCEKLKFVIDTSIKEQLSATIQAYEDKVNNLEEQLKKTRSDMDDALDAHEQYTRINSVRIFGIPEKPNENIADVVVNTIADKLNCPISKADIDICHRLPSNNANHKPIIIKFVRREIKNNIFYNKKKLKGTPIVIREDLTQRRLLILKEAIKRYGSKKVWTSDGKICIKTDNGIKKATTNKQLDLLVNNK